MRLSTPIEAGDDDNTGDEEAGDNDANDLEELVSVKDIGKLCAKIFTDWLKTSLKKQGRQSFATLEARIDKLAAKAKDKLEGDVSKKAIAKLRAMALTRAGRQLRPLCVSRTSCRPTPRARARAQRGMTFASS